MSIESGHWYTRDGKAAHTQKCKTGAKSATRHTTIRDAKAIGLLPSVSGIVKVMSAPALDKWREGAIIETCYNICPGGDESLEEYRAFILEKAFEQVEGAADLGSTVHAALEAHFSGQGYEKTKPVTFPTTGTVLCLQDVVEAAAAKVNDLGIEVKECERVLVNNKWGYAGTTDLLATREGEALVLDYKTKKTKPGRAIEPNESHPLQIAAYWAAYWGGEESVIKRSARGYNVYISTTEPGRIEAVEYDYAALAESWEIFKHLLAIWRWRNGYDPRA